MKEQTHREFYEAFHAWFMQSGVDFWSECDAPEELATIAVELSDRFAAQRGADVDAATGSGDDRGLYHGAPAPNNELLHMTEHNVAVAAAAYCSSRNSVGRHDSELLHILEDTLAERDRVAQQPIEPQTGGGDAGERAVDLLCAMRPDVRREVFADFMAGRSPQTPYLHIDPKEFLGIAAALRSSHREGEAERLERDKILYAEGREAGRREAMEAPFTKSLVAEARTQGYREGATAMREACAEVADAGAQFFNGIDIKFTSASKCATDLAKDIADNIRATPIPGKTDAG